MKELPVPIPGAAIEAARGRIFDSAIRTPLIPFFPDPASGGRPRIWLKLENLQPVGSFKIRGARNALASLGRESLGRGVYTASAGNMALGLAWCCARMEIPCTVIVPDTAPRAKLDRLEQLRARIIPVSFDRWWRVMQDHQYEGVEGSFIHPVANPDVMAGNGTIAAELLEDLPEVDTVLVPFGGGGLSCGIASGLRARSSAARVVGCEVETAAPLTAALRAGKPAPIQRVPSFVDGIGGAGILPEMWPLVRELLAGAAVVPLSEVRRAVRLLAQRARVVAEGAGAVPLGVALSSRSGGEAICCIVSGGNLDSGVLTGILEETPAA